MPALRLTSLPVKIRRPAHALHIPKLIHFASRRLPHLVRRHPVPLRQPSPQHSRVNRERQHLRQIPFHKRLRPVHHIMKQPIPPLISQTSIHNIRHKRRQPRPIRFPLRRQRTNHPRQPRRRPSIPTAPKLFLVLRLRPVIPDVRQQFFLRVPQPLPKSLNLPQRLIVIPRRRQKWWRAIEPVRPHLRLLEHVIQRAIRGPWRLLQDPFQQPSRRLLNLRIPRNLPRSPVRRASHCRVRRPSLDHHRQSSVGLSLHHRRLRQLNHLLVVPSLQKSLRQYPLLPIPSLHSQPRPRRPLNPASRLRTLPANRGLQSARQRRSNSHRRRPAKQFSPPHLNPPIQIRKSSYTPSPSITVTPGLRLTHHYFLWTHLHSYTFALFYFLWF